MICRKLFAFNINKARQQVVQVIALLHKRHELLLDGDLDVGPMAMNRSLALRLHAVGGQFL